MIRVPRRAVGVLVLVVGLMASPRWSSAGEDRPVAAILAEIDAIRLPEPDPAREADEAYVREFWKEHGELTFRRAELIGELYRADPDHPRLAQFMPVRWRTLSGQMMGSEYHPLRDVTAEVDEVFARTRDAELRTNAAYMRAVVVSSFRDRIGAARDYPAKLRAVDAFLTFAPRDARGAELLDLLSHAPAADPARRRALYERIVRDYPESPEAPLARGLLRRLDLEGKELDLAFDDAITGRAVLLRDFRGKVVVLDFWATWCGPCLADMPRIKELYARYHPRGVEFIGVSLDLPRAEGGLDQLRKYVARKAVPWPQYYQGNGWESDFSRGLGIRSVPTLFVVDPAGKLVDLDAGDDLEKRIVEQLGRSAPGP